MFIDEINTRIEAGSDLSVKELEAIKLLVSVEGYRVTKSKNGHAQPITDLGIKYPEPINALTGYLYEGDKKTLFSRLSKQNDWCNQFAGRSQWAKMGRSIVDGCDPIIEGTMYGNSIEIYAYEQTK